MSIPGLWDEHVHMTQWAMAANRVDLSHAASARDAVDIIRSRMAGSAGSTTATARRTAATDRRGGPTLVGVGFRDAVWADDPSLAMLDAVTQGVPAALISHDLHCVWVNSAAAQRYGVDVDASGLLREDPAFALTRELGRLPDAVVDAWVREAAQKAAARGVVGIVDFEMTWNRDVWLRRVSRRLRLTAGGRRRLSGAPGPCPD